VPVPAAYRKRSSGLVSTNPLDYVATMSRLALLTVVETPEFLSTADKLMDDHERAMLVDYLARNATSGVLIPGTGGVRKLRWGLSGRGKRGGARVIYFYHSTDLPLFALTVYAKNEREQLSQKDQNDFRRLIKQLVEAYGTGRKK